MSLYGFPFKTKKKQLEKQSNQYVFLGEFHKSNCNELKAEIDILKKKNHSLILENGILRQEKNEGLKQGKSDCHCDCDEFKAEIDILKKKNDLLISENGILKQEKSDSDNRIRDGNIEIEKLQNYTRENYTRENNPQNLKEEVEELRKIVQIQELDDKDKIIQYMAERLKGFGVKNPMALPRTAEIVLKDMNERTLRKEIIIGKMNLESENKDLESLSKEYEEIINDISVFEEEYLMTTGGKKYINDSLIPWFVEHGKLVKNDILKDIDVIEPDFGRTWENDAEDYTPTEEFQKKLQMFITPETVTEQLNKKNKGTSATREGGLNLSHLKHSIKPSNGNTHVANRIFKPRKEEPSCTNMQASLLNEKIVFELMRFFYNEELDTIIENEINKRYNEDEIGIFDSDDVYGQYFKKYKDQIVHEKKNLRLPYFDKQKGFVVLSNYLKSNLNQSLEELKRKLFNTDTFKNLYQDSTKTMSIYPHYTMKEVWKVYLFTKPQYWIKNRVNNKNVFKFCGWRETGNNVECKNWLENKKDFIFLIICTKFMLSAAFGMIEKIKREIERCLTHLDLYGYIYLKAGIYYNFKEIKEEFNNDYGVDKIFKEQRYFLSTFDHTIKKICRVDVDVDVDDIMIPKKENNKYYD